MNHSYLFLPMLGHMLLVIVLYILLGKRKAKAVKQGLVNRQEAALNNQVWPDEVRQVSNNIANQFELPILFHCLVLINVFISPHNLVTLTLASSFVVLRFAHSYIHVTSNTVPYRLRLFLISTLVFLAMMGSTVYLFFSS